MSAPPLRFVDMLEKWIAKSHPSVTDYFCNTIYEARAPAAGVVLYICGVPSIKKGDTVANIGEITTNP